MMHIKDRSVMWRLIFLELGMLSPIVIMCISLVYFDMFTLSALLYNGLSLTIVPLIYMKYISPPPSVIDTRSIGYYLRDKL